jgi:hypothetical protein
MCKCGMGASLPRKYCRTCCQKLGWCTRRYVVWNCGKRRFVGSCLGFTVSFGAGSAAGAVAGRVGPKTGELWIGVAALLESSDSVGVSTGELLAFERPRSDLNDLFANDSLGSFNSALGACCGSLAPSLVCGCSVSLNWAASGFDCEGVSKTATSPTCLCASPSPGLLSALGFPLYQKAQAAGFEEASLVADFVSVAPSAVVSVAISCAGGVPCGASVSCDSDTGARASF